MLLNFDSITVRLWVKKRKFHIWQRWARAINLIGHHLCYGFSLDPERILRSQHIVSLCARSWFQVSGGVYLTKALRGAAYRLKEV